MILKRTKFLHYRWPVLTGVMAFSAFSWLFIPAPVFAQSLLDLVAANTGKAELAGGTAGAASAVVPPPSGALPQQPMQLPMQATPPPAAPVALPVGAAPSLPLSALQGLVPPSGAKLQIPMQLPMQAASPSVPALAPGQERIDMSGPISSKDGKPEIPSFQGFDIKASSNKNKIKSLFYSQTEINDIHLAVNTYLKHLSNNDELSFDEEAFLNRLGGLKRSSSAQARYFTYPQFFLDSLVYHSADSWIVWVNGRKITNDTPKDSTNIQVVAITPDTTTLEWFPSQMDRVLEIWNQSPNNDVQVDVGKAKVTFTLKPNQTFSSYTMNVLEGKALPVTVDIATLGHLQNLKVSLDGQAIGDEQGAPAEEKKVEEKPQAAPVDDKKAKEGIGGLIDSYKNMPKGDQQ